MHDDYTTDTTPSKQCTKCKAWFPPTNQYFSTKSKSNGKIGSWCLACLEKRRDYYNRRVEEMKSSNAKWRANNKDKINEKASIYRKDKAWKANEYSAEYRKNNPDKVKSDNKKYRAENREKLRQLNKEWRLANEEELKKKTREYREKNRNTINAKIKEWRKKNHAIVRVKNQKRKARKLSLPHTLTAQQWQSALNYFHGCCAYCGRPAGLFHVIAVEHFFPLSFPDCPGTTALNCIPACHSNDGCNNKKCNKDPYKWLDETFGSREVSKILARINAYWEHVRTHHD